MKTIIVPTDFSAVSINAAEYALDVANYLQANLQLIHILPLPVTLGDVPIPYDNYDISIEEANKSMDDLKTRLQQRCDNKISITAHVTSGTFQRQITGMLEGKEDTFIVMGTKGSGVTETFFLGNYALTAARDFSCPVLLIPPDLRFKGIHKMGLACDMKNVMETIPFTDIRTLLESFNAKLEVLYISKADEQMYPDILSETKFIQNNLERFHPEIRISTHENIGEGITRFVNENNIDMLLLIPKERNFVERIFHKSVTKDMILHPQTALMILHK